MSSGALQDKLGGALNASVRAFRSATTSARDAVTEIDWEQVNERVISGAKKGTAVAKGAASDVAWTVAVTAAHGARSVQNRKKQAGQSLSNWALGVNASSAAFREAQDRTDADDVMSVMSAGVLPDRSGYGVPLRRKPKPYRTEFHENHLTRIVRTPKAWHAPLSCLLLSFALPCFVLRMFFWDIIEKGGRAYIMFTLVMIATIFGCTVSHAVYKYWKSKQIEVIPEPHEPVMVHERCSLCRERFDGLCGNDKFDACRGIVTEELSKPVSLRKEIRLTCPVTRGRCGHPFHFHCIARFSAIRTRMRKDLICPHESHEGFAPWIWGGDDVSEEFDFWFRKYNRVLENTAHQESQLMREREFKIAQEEEQKELGRIRAEVEKQQREARKRKGKRGVGGDADLEAGSVMTGLSEDGGASSEEETKKGGLAVVFEEEDLRPSQYLDYDFSEYEQGEEDEAVERGPETLELDDYRAIPNEELAHAIEQATALENIRQTKQVYLLGKDSKMRRKAALVATGKTLEPFDPEPVITKAKRAVEGKPSALHQYEHAKMIADEARSRMKAMQNRPVGGPRSGEVAQKEYETKHRLVEVVQGVGAAGTAVDDPHQRDHAGKQWTKLRRQVIAQRITSHLAKEGKELEITVPRFDPIELRRKTEARKRSEATMSRTPAEKLQQAMERRLDSIVPSRRKQAKEREFLAKLKKGEARAATGRLEAAVHIAKQGGAVNTVVGSVGGLPSNKELGAARKSTAATSRVVAPLKPTSDSDSGDDEASPMRRQRPPSAESPSRGKKAGKQADRVDVLGRPISTWSERADEVAKTSAAGVRASRMQQVADAHRFGLEGSPSSSATSAKTARPTSAAGQELLRRMAAQPTAASGPPGMAGADKGAKQRVVAPQRMSNWHGALTVAATKQLRRKERQLGIAGTQFASAVEVAAGHRGPDGISPFVAKALKQKAKRSKEKKRKKRRKGKRRVSALSKQKNAMDDPLVATMEDDEASVVSASSILSRGSNVSLAVQSLASVASRLDALPE